MNSKKPLEKVLLLGCGLQSFGVALDLLTYGQPKHLVLADAFPQTIKNLKSFLDQHSSLHQSKNTQFTELTLDAGKTSDIVQAAQGCELILNAAPYRYILEITHAAIQAKVPLVDLGGDTTMVLKQLELHEKAKEANITIVPDCGMGPGMTNITVGHAMELLDTAENIETVDGGIPLHPQPPLYYHLVFAIETLVNEYTGKTTAIRNGKIVEIEPLAEISDYEMPIIGKVQATHGMGMLSSLPWTYQGRVQNLDNKFVRYPGHLAFIDTLKKAGFFSREMIETEAGPAQPRAVTKALLEKFLQKDKDARDISLIRTVSIGQKDGTRYQVEHFIADYSDPKTGLTSMQRTTGFTASIVGQMIARGEITQKGVIPPELAVPKLAFFEDIKKRGFECHWTQKKL